MILMAKLIAVANRKGGVGKTTTAICLAHFVARRDGRVLLIDLDPQNALAAALSPAGEEVSEGVVDILRGKPDTPQVVRRTVLSNVDLIAYSGSESRSHDDERLFALPEKGALFTRVLSDLSKKYGYILLDSPPGSSAIVQFTLSHSDSVIIPLQCQPLALRIMPRILSDIRQLIGAGGPSLRVEGVLLTMYDFWDPVSQNIADQVWSHFPKQSTFRAIIRKSPVFERIFDSEKNPLLEQNLPEELLDYDIIAQLILDKENKDRRRT